MQNLIWTCDPSWSQTWEKSVWWLHFNPRAMVWHSSKDLQRAAALWALHPQGEALGVG